MDLAILAAENYQEGAATTTQSAQNGVKTGLYGIVLDDKDSNSVTKPVLNPQRNMKTRHSYRKDASKNTNADETNRQRGRPRIDAQDSTSAEVLY